MEVLILLIGSFSFLFFKRIRENKETKVYDWKDFE